MIITLRYSLGILKSIFYWFPPIFLCFTIYPLQGINMIIFFAYTIVNFLLIITRIMFQEMYQTATTWTGTCFYHGFYKLYSEANKHSTKELQMEDKNFITYRFNKPRKRALLSYIYANLQLKLRRTRLQRFYVACPHLSSPNWPYQNGTRQFPCCWRCL